jgi:hypothetical protein
MNAMSIARKIDEDFIEKLNRVRRYRAAWDTAQNQFAPILEKFVALGSEPYAADSDYIIVSLIGDAHLLADGVRILRTAGFNTYAEKPKRNDPNWSALFSHPDTADLMRIYLSFSSSVCRRVKVGTEIREVDIYETQCGEGEVFGAE